MENIPASYVIVGLIVGILAIGFVGAPLWAWTALGAAVLWLLDAPETLWVPFLALAAVFNLVPIRRALVSSLVMRAMKGLGLLPVISATERDALQAGDVWMERELFSGRPDFKRLMQQSFPKLRPEEQAFLDGPVERLCASLTDWEVHQRRDLPPAAWEIIKREKFWGMIIPKEYGGLGFSATAHSAVIQKLSSRSVPLAITVMVPNSLGPAELLIHYGTKEQKDHYLPRLARGEEIPCFALTEPHAGSDAASIQASGVVFRGESGKLHLRLNWNKRWITLAGISTVIGLAFRLRDPDNLLGLGKGEDVGITCALIPRATPGVAADQRHDPLGVPFYNCPTQGKDVVVPIDAIIGGVEGAGRGWRMLMECLAAGRGISLPSQSTCAAKYVSRVASAHAVVRRQFGASIGNFEGIGEVLARLGGTAYMLEAARLYTLGAIDSGVKPPVVTAMCKYYFTEAQRRVMNDGMDVLGGAAITCGPRNLLANGYSAIPISITVEGANILTRTLIIFGQGALRAHPYALREVEAVEKNDRAAFDRAFWGHIGHIVRNTFRAKLLTLTRGWLAWPYRGGPTARYYRRLAWASAVFAIMTDIAMGALGGKLKVKGKTTGRFADVLAFMYLATATLRRFEAEGRRAEDLPFVDWVMAECFSQIQKAFDGLFANFDVPVLGWLYARPVRWFWALNPIGLPPSDAQDLKLAHLIQTPGEQRDRLTSGLYLSPDPTDPFRRLESALVRTLESEQAFAKVRRAVKRGQLKKQPGPQLYRDAVAQGVITQAEFDTVASAEALRDECVQVDSFTFEEYFASAVRK